MRNGPDCGFIFSVKDRKKVWAFASLIVIVLLWGSVPVIGKYLLERDVYSPSLLVAVRGLLATITMVIVVLISKAYRFLNKSYWICLPAGLILAAAYLFQFIGLDTTTTTKSVFLESFSVVATPITLLILIKEKPRWNTSVAALLCLVGAFILCGEGWNFSALFKAPTMGDIFSAIGGALFGVNIAFTQVYAKKKNAFLYVTFQMGILTLLTFGYALLFERPLRFSWDTGNLFILLYLGVFCTALCWVVRAVSVRHIGAVTIAVMNPMSAVFATVLSLALGQETFNANLLVGALIILSAIVLSSLPLPQKQTKVTPEYHQPESK